MPTFITRIAVVGLSFGLAFCLFGFLATFEPAPLPGQFLGFRIAYAVSGLLCLVAATSLIVRGRK